MQLVSYINMYPTPSERSKFPVKIVNNALIDVMAQKESFKFLDRLNDSVLVADGGYNED